MRFRYSLASVPIAAAVEDRRLFVLRADGEYEQMKLGLRAVSKRVWARLEAAYPLKSEQDEVAAD